MATITMNQAQSTVSGNPFIPGRTAEDECLLASGKLSIGGADLSFAESVAARTIATGTREAAPARALGYDAGLELRLCALQPADQA